MKALTLTQPWATLVALGEKRLETRSWSTGYRGPLAIHAAKGLGPVGGKRGLEELCERHAFAYALDWHAAHPHLLPRGAVVATATLVDVLRIVDDAEEIPDPGTTSREHVETGGRDAGFGAYEPELGDYTPGRFAWVLTDVRRLEPPVEASGMLGLWDVELP